MKRCSYCGKEYADDTLICAIDGTPIHEEQPKSDPSTRERIWKAYLVLCSIGSALAVFSYLKHWQWMNETFPGHPLIAFRSIVFLRPLALAAIWLDSRAGVIAYIGLSVISILVSFIIGSWIALTGLFGTALLIVLVRPRWSKMSWEAKLPGSETNDGIEITSPEASMKGDSAVHDPDKANSAREDLNL